MDKKWLAVIVVSCLIVIAGGQFYQYQSWKLNRIAFYNQFGEYPATNQSIRRYSVRYFVAQKLISLRDKVESVKREIIVDGEENRRAKKTTPEEVLAYIDNCETWQRLFVTRDLFQRHFDDACRLAVKNGFEAEARACGWQPK